MKMNCKTFSGHFELLMSLNERANKGVTVLAGVIDPY